MSQYQSIGEFADVTWLSAKALRLYDENGLLPPAAVDPVNGYRLYERRQVDDARLITLLRRLNMEVQFPRILAAFEAVRLEAGRAGRTLSGAPREVYPARPEDPRPICQIAQPYVGAPGSLSTEFL